jgi:SAM-dependent methyltransferase
MIDSAQTLASTPSEFISAVDAVWGDPATWVAEGDQWSHLPQIMATINRRVTGDPDCQPIAWFFHTVGQQQAIPLGKIMVLGCGSAGVEQDLVRKGWVQEAVGVDLSPRALERMTEAAATEALPGVRYRQADMNALPLGTADFEPGTYDAIFGISGVHHCDNLEELYAGIAGLLKPRGWFYLDEYIGPARFQWTPTQVALVSGFLAALPESLARTRSGILKRGYRRPTPADVIALDPSEAVRSDKIVPLLPSHFTIESFRGYGGSLLHLVLAQIAHNFRSDPDGLVSRLIELEEQSLSDGLLTDDFAVIIARKRGE